MRDATGYMAGDKYTTGFLWTSEIDHALVVDCSDPRLFRARNEFLNHLGLYLPDPIFTPGGHLRLLDLSSAYLQDAAFLHELHEFHLVIGIAHFDCGYYKSRYPDASEGERYCCQIDDLIVFGHTMRRIATCAEVKLYYAGSNDEDFIEYKRIG